MNNSRKALGILIAAGFVVAARADTDANPSAALKATPVGTVKKTTPKETSPSKTTVPTSEQPLSVVTTDLPAPVGPDIKKAIGSVDVYKIFQQSEQAREDEKRIITECENKKKAIEDSFLRLRKVQEELQGMRDTATDAAKERKVEEGRELQQSIEIKKQGLEEYQSRAAQEAQMRLLKEVEETTEEVRRERGLVIVFAGGTLAIDPSIDLSVEVATRMNKKHAAKKERQAPSRITT